jgi:dolichol-phosphate mannosyltransferase
VVRLGLHGPAERDLPRRAAHAITGIPGAEFPFSRTMAAPQTKNTAPSSPPGPPALSVVVPVLDEAENLRPLIDEIAAALDGGSEYEIVYVDDGSGDGTPDRLAVLAAEYPRLRWVRHRTRQGQSAAILSGVKAARAPLIATLDGDGQNDPADIPKLLARFAREGAGDDGPMIAGERAKRRDSRFKRVSSRIANCVRDGLLKDHTPDTGCGLKVFPRAAFLAMPNFDHMHRFLPALMIRGGGRVVSVLVGHRPRGAGVSKYGVLDRLWIGIVDLLGVMWLQRRPMALDIVVEDQEPRTRQP